MHRLDMGAETLGNMANVSTAVLRVGDATSLEPVVLAFSGEEQLGRLFSFRIDVGIDEALAESLCEEGLVGQPAALTLETLEAERTIRGLISSCEYAGVGHSHVYYRIELSPPAWVLTQRVNSRIFQELATPDIIREVLKDHGLAGESVHFALEEVYEFAPAAVPTQCPGILPGIETPPGRPPCPRPAAGRGGSAPRPWNKRRS